MKAIIMAAGKGTRLFDEEHPCPKVLRQANGRPLLAYVLDTIRDLPNDDIVIVVKHMEQEIRRAFPERHFVTQGDDGYGTGYAVRCAIDGSSLKDYDGEILILSGDAPCTKKETIDAMLRMHRQTGAACTLLSCRSKRPLPFGRIIRDAAGEVVAIKEHKDCTEEERKIDELNVALYIFNGKELRSALAQLDNHNAAGEYYITDVPAILLRKGLAVKGYITEDEEEMWGVNTVEDLRQVEDILRRRQSAAEKS